MTLVARLIALLSGLASKVAGLAALICLVLVGAGVVARYFFNAAQSWIDESATWLVIIMVLLAMPEAQRLNANIGVDALVMKFNRRGQRLLALFSALSVAVVGGLMLWAGIETVSFSQMIGIKANTMAWVPMWWIQVFLPIGGSLLLLVSLVQLFEVFSPNWQPPNADDPIHGTRSHE
ncbi:TRAP transporter small permease [Ferrovibrio sp.]|uniref:TRAP transporter small permease n=1 Tax=Ferrovibrio sp. TaxID=1917215 RepID=UPI003D0E4403